MHNSREENVTCHMSAIYGGVNFRCADAQGLGNKNRQIPEPRRKKISIPMWKPQSMDRCLPFEHLHGKRCSGCIGESIYFIQWRKKGLEGGRIELLFVKGVSLKENLFQPFLFYNFRWAARMDTFIELSATSTNCQCAEPFANTTLAI